MICDQLPTYRLPGQLLIPVGYCRRIGVALHPPAAPDSMATAQGSCRFGLTEGLGSADVVLEHVLHVRSLISVFDALLVCIRERARACCLDAVRDLERAPALDFGQRGNHMLMLNRANGHRTDLRENIDLQSPESISGGRFSPCGHLVCVPLARQLLESVAVGFGQFALTLFLLMAGVYALIEQLTGRQPLVARFREGDFRIFAKSQRTAKFTVPVIHTLILGPINVDQKVKPIAVGKFVWLLFGLGGTWLDISEGNSKFRHVTVSVLTVCFDTVKVTGFQWTKLDLQKRKTYDLTGSFAGFCTSSDYLPHVLGGERGIHILRRSPR